MKFTLAKAETAGAVVYKSAIKIKAYPADFLASLTLGTVKILLLHEVNLQFRTLMRQL